MTFHFIGIGGVGMAAVAELLVSRGQQVSGSDRAESANTERLAAMGVDIHIGHDALNVPPGAHVVVSSAIKESNPELAHARSHGYRVLHRSEALAIASAGLTFVAVAGAHGKTTTSAMVAHALQVAGQDPSWAIGATLAGGASGAHLGQGDVMIAEADESDGSFLNYQPHIEIITNIEPDHLDHYGSSQALEEAFAQFAELRDGPLVINTDNDYTRRLIAGDHGDIWSYGVTTVPGTHAHLSLNPDTNEVTFTSSATHGRAAELNGHTWTLEMPTPGVHMALNATAALAVGLYLGIDAEVLIDGLATFGGTGRRAETKGEAGGVTVIDDYAHHPTEVKATLQAARTRPGRVIVLFQPHLYSRTRDFATEFASALELADVAVVTGVYGAREEPMDGIDGHIITDHMTGGVFIADKDEAADYVVGIAQAGDTIWTMGAGDVTTLGPRILEQLA